MKTPALLSGGLALLITITSSALTFAQGVGINATGAPADASAMLDVASTTKGFLPPRMTAAQRAAIALPATGLVVYQTDGTVGLYYNAGTPAAPSWQVAGAGAAGQWSVNGTSLYYSAGSIGIGRNPPLAPLDVLGGNWDLASSEGDLRIGNGLTRLKFGIATGGGGTGAATIMEQGPVGAYNVLSLGTQGNKVLHVNGATQRVGIGTDAPTAPLGFAPTLGKKVALYSGASGDYGFGIANGRLQITAEAAGSDVAIGSDAGGTFTERLAVKTNGAIAVNGNAGAAGQLLRSNGPAQPPTWSAPATIQQATSTGNVVLSELQGAAIPGLSLSFTIPAQGANVMVQFTVHASLSDCLVCTGATLAVHVSVDGGGALAGAAGPILTTLDSQSVAGSCLLTGLAAGPHTLGLSAVNSVGQQIVAGTGYVGGASLKSVLIAQLIPN